MTVDLTQIIIAGLASTVVTLAGYIYYGMRAECQKLQAQNTAYQRIILQRASERDETIARVVAMLGKYEDLEEVE